MFHPPPPTSPCPHLTPNSIPIIHIGKPTWTGQFQRPQQTRHTGTSRGASPQLTRPPACACAWQPEGKKHGEEAGGLNADRYKPACRPLDYRTRVSACAGLHERIPTAPANAADIVLTEKGGSVHDVGHWPTPSSEGEQKRTKRTIPMKTNLKQATCATEWSRGLREACITPCAYMSVSIDLHWNVPLDLLFLGDRKVTLYIAFFEPLPKLDAEACLRLRYTAPSSTLIAQKYHSQGNPSPHHHLNNTQLPKLSPCNSRSAISVKSVTSITPAGEIPALPSLPPLPAATSQAHPSSP